MCTILSTFVVAHYFDFVFYSDTLRIQCIFQMLSIAYQSGAQLVTLHRIRSLLLDSKVAEAEFLMNVSTIQQTCMALVLSVIGACLFNLLDIQKNRSVEYFVMMICGPFFTVFNYSQDFRFFSENRRLLHFSRAIMTTILQLAIEFVLYFSQK